MTTPGNINFDWDALSQKLSLNGQMVLGGIVGPFFAPAGTSIIYHDISSNRLKASENGGAPVNVLTGGGGGSAYTFVQTNGVGQPQEDTLNLIGNSFSAADVPGSKTNVTLNQSPADSTSVVGTGRLINTAAPLAGGGDLTADRTLSIPQATSLVDGFLSHIDWSTFNAKVSATRAINTTAPISGGGDLTTDRTFSMHVADATHDGYLSSTDWNSFNAGGAGGVPATRNINTTVPLTGGGDLSADRTLGITQADATHNGFLTFTDWNTFNNKVSTTRAINTGTGLTGGGDLSADRTLSVVANTTNQQVRIDKNGTFVGQRKEVNLIEGTNVTMTVSDNAGSDSVDVTINSSGGGGGTDQSVRVFNSASFSIPNAAFTVLPFDSEDFDTNNLHDTVVNNSRLTAQVAGKYVVSADIAFQGTAAGVSTYAITIRKNGTTRIALAQTAVNTPTFDQVMNVNTIIDMIIGDYVEVEAFQNTGAAVNATRNADYTYIFEMAKILG